MSSNTDAKVKRRLSAKPVHKLAKPDSEAESLGSNHSLRQCRECGESFISHRGKRICPACGDTIIKGQWK